MKPACMVSRLLCSSDLLITRTNKKQWQQINVEVSARYDLTLHYDKNYSTHELQIAIDNMHILQYINYKKQLCYPLRHYDVYTHVQCSDDGPSRHAVDRKSALLYVCKLTLPLTLILKLKIINDFMFDC